MSIEKPELGLLVIQCDACDEFIEFFSDEGEPTGDPAECLRRAKKVGWISQKPIGSDWLQFCEACAMVAATEARRKHELDEERERIKQRNAGR